MLKQEKRQRELKMTSNIEQADSPVLAPNDNECLLDDTTPAIKQSLINSEEDTTDDTDVLSQEIA